MTIAPIVTNPISDVTVGSNPQDTTLSLSSYFDDPATTGAIAQFQLYNQFLGNGTINVVLFDQAGSGAPLTVQNFLNYVNDGDYINSIIHRSVSNFVIQGGGFTVENLIPIEIPEDAAVQNEYSADRSNLRGTIAMAKLGTDPNSATSQWFFNLADNSSNLDNQNGGFTVFGQVLSSADLTTIDAIAAVPVFNGSSLNSAFSDLPLQIDTNNPQLTGDNDFVRFSNISVFDADELKFTVTYNSNPTLVNVTVNGLDLNLDYLSNQGGTAVITIAATNLFGQSIEDTFTITVANSTNFDPAQYGASNLDLLSFGYDLNALTQHYFNAGQAEGRPLDTFDEKAYLASYDDLLRGFGTDLGLATQHYIVSGAGEGRTITFNSTQYLASNRDLILGLGNAPDAAATHFIQSGWGERRSRDSFREDIYLASHGDLIDGLGYDLAGATQHYINFGAEEGRLTELFDPIAYVNKYSDLQGFGSDLTAATRHYIEHGYGEGRSWL